LLIVLAGPSGTGKSTILERVFASDGRLSFSISHTTRPARPGEIDGQSYHFVDPETFTHMVEDHAFAEWAQVHSLHRYGTSKAEIQRLCDADRDIVFDVDVQGASSLRTAYPDCVTVFILPPSMQILERRLRGRGTESDANIELRLESARNELIQATTFDYLIVNEHIDSAATALQAIIRAERMRATRQPELVTRLLSPAS